MMKKILGIVLAVALVFSTIPSMAYSVRDAYRDFVSQHPGFVDDLIEAGEGQVTEALIIELLADIQDFLARVNRSTPVTRGNLEKNLVAAVERLGAQSKYAPIIAAITIAYPGAAGQVAKGNIPAELMPLYETMESMIFDHNMLEDIDNGNNETASQIIEIGELDDVTVTKGADLKLPGSVSAQSDSGVEVRLPIEWTDIPSTGSVGTFTANGTIEVPEGYELASGLSTAISVTVIVEASKDNDDNNGGNGNGNSGNGNSGNGSSGNGGGNRNPVTGSDKTNKDDTTTTVTHKFKFSDVPSDTTEAGKAIYALSDMGAISGYTDGTFLPGKQITRAEFTRIAVSALGIYKEDAQTELLDIANDAWYRSYVASAVNNGLISGYPDGTFKPDNQITRAEVMTIIWRIMSSNNVLSASAVSPAPYADDAAIPEFARDYVYTLAANGIVSASADNKITAEVPATREQCAVMLYNTLVKLGKIK